MKKLVGIILLIVVVASCTKPHHMTREGKKKIKYYNDVFFSRQKQDFKHK